jgi:hypothetical protein
MGLAKETKLRVGGTDHILLMAHARHTTEHALHTRDKHAVHVTCIVASHAPTCA